MDISYKDLRRRLPASPTPTLSPAFRFQHESLRKNLARASLLSPPSDHPSDAAHDLDELDEQDVWSLHATSEEDSTASGDLSKGQAALPPRIGSAGRKGGSRSGTPERRPLKNGSLPWAWTAVKGLNTVSGLSSESNGIRYTTGRIVGSESTARRIPTVSRMIPRVAVEEGSSVKQNLEGGLRQGLPQSAPVNIPDWSRAAQNESKKGKWVLGHDDEQDEQDEERLPPHEFLAREYARSQMTSFSVLEGAGRTLKGRDISRVRDAVLTRTGFLD